MNLVSLILYPSMAFVLTIILGFWLSRLGQPYHQVVFNIHKLIALAAVVMVGVGFSNRFKSGEVQSEWILLVVVVALMTIILFASGALMSLDKLDYKLLRLLHRIAPIGLVLVGVWMFVTG
ncbi:MAG: hypothetical protein IH585_16675 [Anaerolineaceae bacterium]|nr:hypothetical protein [Anaerolineaceae bacterium]